MVSAATVTETNAGKQRRRIMCALLVCQDSGRSSCEGWMQPTGGCDHRESCPNPTARTLISCGTSWRGKPRTVKGENASPDNLPGDRETSLPDRIIRHYVTARVNGSRDHRWCKRGHPVGRPCEGTLIRTEETPDYSCERQALLHLPARRSVLEHLRQCVEDRPGRAGVHVPGHLTTMSFLTRTVPIASSRAK